VGAGPKLRERLIREGIETIQDLLKTPLTELLAIQGVGEKTAEKLLEEARELDARRNSELQEVAAKAEALKAEALKAEALKAEAAKAAEAEAQAAEAAKAEASAEMSAAPATPEDKDVSPAEAPGEAEETKPEA
ncbi:MAG: helix-hairpin-helix domain-containing protein, partial [Candidatus Eiseniibacteriota bacterium]